jgi:putative transposase
VSLAKTLLGFEIKHLLRVAALRPHVIRGGMLQILRLVLGTITPLFSTRRSLVLENLALRQQLVVFKRRHCKPRLRLFDKLFWVAARQVWSDWKQSLILVRPATVVQWHRARFKLYWRVLSRTWRPRGGRPLISKEIRDLIFNMLAENPTWGAPQAGHHKS